MSTDFWTGAVWALLCITVGVIIGCLIALGMDAGSPPPEPPDELPPDPFPELDLMDERMKLDALDRFLEDE